MFQQKHHQEIMMELKKDLDQSQTPQLCIMGCGFFADPKNQNLCSLCFKKVMNDIFYVRVTDKSRLKLNHNSVDIKKRNRCRVCNKRAGLVAFGCRCGHTFCERHRMPEVHECEYDFKAAGRAILQKQNPFCVVDKLEARI